MQSEQLGIEVMIWNVPGVLSAGPHCVGPGGSLSCAAMPVEQPWQLCWGLGIWNGFSYCWLSVQCAKSHLDCAKKAFMWVLHPVRCNRHF